MMKFYFINKNNLFFSFLGMKLHATFPVVHVNKSHTRFSDERFFRPIILWKK